MPASIIKNGLKQAWDVKGWISSLGEENTDMQVTKLMPADQERANSGHKFTQEELQREFNYIQAERITKKLLEKGLITDEEFNRITTENKRAFPTFLSPLL